MMFARMSKNDPVTKLSVAPLSHAYPQKLELLEKQSGRKIDSAAEIQFSILQCPNILVFSYERFVDFNCSSIPFLLECPDAQLLHMAPEQSWIIIDSVSSVILYLYGQMDTSTGTGISLITTLST